MGSCCLPRQVNTQYKIDNNLSSRQIHLNTQNNHNKSTITVQDQEKEVEEFKDLTIITDKFKGFGIKKMNAYKCNLNIDDLNKLREHFWWTKYKINEKWKILRQACLYDFVKGEEYLLQHGFVPVNGCINYCTDIDGKTYKIPNYCINDPYFEKEWIPIENKETYSGMIKITVGEADKKVKLKVKENISVKDWKDLYRQKNDIAPDWNVRLFFGGNELKDNECLFQHKILTGFAVQAICLKVIE